MSDLKIGKTFPMSMYMSSKDREKAIFEHMRALESRISEALEIMEEAIDLFEDAKKGNYKIDSFTSQPMRTWIASTEFKKQNEWISVEQFKQDPTDICFIKYKNKTLYSIYNYAFKRFESIPSGNVFMSKCISKVMRIPIPTDSGE